jgi:tetratricopeptide (TPR) repeat protein
LEQAAQAYRRSSRHRAGAWPRPQARFEAEQCWGQILTLQGQYEEALRHFEQARQLLPAVPTDSADICRLARLDYELTQVLTNQGRYQEVLETIEHGLSLPDIAAHVIGAQLQMQRAVFISRETTPKRSSGSAERGNGA